MWNSPWIRGTSRYIPIYSGEKGCLNHWQSWNRGLVLQQEKQLLLPEPNLGDTAKDITPEE